MLKAWFAAVLTETGSRIFRIMGWNKRKRAHNCTVEPWFTHSKEISEVALLPATLPDLCLNMKSKNTGRTNTWVQHEYLKSSRWSVQYRVFSSPPFTQRGIENTPKVSRRRRSIRSVNPRRERGKKGSAEWEWHGPGGGRGRGAGGRRRRGGRGARQRGGRGCRRGAP